METIKDKTAFEALQLGAATNVEYDPLVVASKLSGWHWTSTMAAYEKAGVPFGKSIIFQSGNETWKITVPKKYQGKRNLVLLANLSPKEGKKEGSVVTLTPKKITAKPMPEQNGWYMPDEFGFPSGNASSNSDETARYLWRRDICAYVGLLSRGSYWWFGYYRRVVLADYYGYYRFGVMISNTGKSGNIDLRTFTKEAKQAIEKMRGAVKEELLTPLDKLVEAAER